MTRKLFTLSCLCAAVLLLSLIPSGPAAAACATPAGTAGTILYNSSEKIFQYCNDTSWMNMGQPGTGSGGCASPTLNEGGMAYNADHRVMQGCAGNTHQAFGPVGGELGWRQIAAGSSHSCGVKTNGTLYCWGDDGDGQLGNGAGTNADQHIPMQESTTATNWASVATGDIHTCAIKTNGTLWCWGSDSDGQLGNGAGVTSATSPVQETTGATNWETVTAGTAYTCAIKTDGSAWCWGGDFNGKLGNGAGLTADQHSPSAVTGGATWSAISAGEHFTCGIKTDGSAWCWGQDTGGQLGNGGVTGNQPDPSAVTGGATWSAISAGNNHSCGVRTDNSAWCWGNGSNGRLGNGATVNQPDPVTVSGGSTWSEVRSGFGYSCGIKTDGTLHCWGSNVSGQLGDGTLTQRTAPVASIAGSDWMAVSAGVAHTCALRTNGAVQCWGETAGGRLGDNGSEHLVSPTPISSPAGWLSVSGSGNTHSCGIKADGSLWCWGNNSDGQLGDNTTTRRLVPTAVSGGGTWLQVSAGGLHSCGIKTDSTLWCWGQGGNGALGNGGTGNLLVPTAVAGTWLQVSAGSIHTCGIKTDNTLWCWGYNGAGRLGDNTTTQRNSPTAINGGGTWLQVSASKLNTCGIKTDNTLWCWGDNGSGEVGDGTSTQRLVPTSVNGGGTWAQVSGGGNHTCGLKSNYTLWCWGYNGSGRLGDNTTLQRLVPTAISGSDTWLQISAGDVHTCGIKTDDTLWCWGDNGLGEVGDGTSTQRLVPTSVNGGGTWSSVTTGGTHTCAVATGGGYLYCWGSNSNGQTTVTEFSAPYKTAASRMWCNDPPAKPGGMVYNTDTDVIQYCDSAGWVSVGGTAPDLVAVPDGLIGYWKFDETSGATTAADSSGNGRTGTLTNMAPASDWVAGHSGNALDFDGTNDYVSVTSAPALDNIKPVSACAWIYRRTAGNSYPTIIDKSTTGTDGFNFYLEESSSALGYYSNDGDFKQYGSLALNTWEHICYTYSGAGAGTTAADIKLYLNGVELSPGAAASVNGTPSDDSLNNLTIGSGGSNAYPFNGMIDEVRLYNRVLSLSEIQALAAQ
ncbi:MAG: RCC1 domain-containing protein [Micavibrio sp.]